MLKREGGLPCIVIWKRVSLKIDEGLSGGGRLCSRSSHRRNSCFVVFGPLNIAAGPCGDQLVLVLRSLAHVLSNVMAF